MTSLATQGRRDRFWKNLSVLLGVLGILFAYVAPAMATTEHCPEGGTKTEGEYNALVLDAGTEFCVKAGTEASGILTADGETPLGDYVSWTVGQGNTPDVSYYVVYEREEPPTTTTTVPETTTTTQPEVTTTTVPPPPVTTTTTEPCFDNEHRLDDGTCGIVPIPEEEPIAPDEENPPPPRTETTLPFTGPDVPTGHLAGFALAALALGTALTYTTKENA